MRTKEVIELVSGDLGFGEVRLIACGRVCACACACVCTGDLWEFVEKSNVRATGRVSPLATVF